MQARVFSHRNGHPSPNHIAIIMDGNGRWAEARGMPRIAGHKKGADAARKTIECAMSHGVKYLTLFGFSSENWKRPEEEISELMSLLRHYLVNDIDELKKNGVRLRVIGERFELSSDIVELIEECELKTKDNHEINLIIALSYGSRAEITSAVRSLADKSVSGEINPDQIDEAMIEKHLSTSDIPDPDLLIRTSGEKRISNFLLWQLAYAELVFVDCLWPDFDDIAFSNAISEFNRRERRYGATN